MIPPQLRRLILRLAGENPTEDRRIHRERTQLGDKLAASTMPLLQRAGMESAPRRAGLRWVWLLCRDCLTWETSGSVGRGAAAPLGAVREERFVPNQSPAGTTVLATGIG